MRYYIFLLAICFSVTTYATDMPNDDWGKTGHRTTGEIATKYLSKKAKRKIAALLDGMSLAEASTFGDEIKSEKAYRKYGPWHYVNVPFDTTYEAHPKSDRGDVLAGIEKCVTVLKDEKSTAADKAFFLKLLVHFVGDLHQPLHAGISDDKGGNDFQVQWFRDGTNIHRVWDTSMIENYGMSYTELAENTAALSKAQVKALQAGNAVDWFNDSRVLVKEIYATTKKGDKLGYRYMYDYFPVVRKQLLKGGVRLAGLLNEIFS